jgi:hypothetical protein
MIKIKSFLLLDKKITTSSSWEETRGSKKLRCSKEGEEEAMAMKKKRNRERTGEKRRKIHKRKGKENQTVFCNGHCGQQKLPLQLTGEPGMGQQSLLMFSSINIFIYKNRFYFNFLGSICILL